MKNPWLHDFFNKIAVTLIILMVLSLVVPGIIQLVTYATLNNESVSATILQNLGYTTAKAGVVTGNQTPSANDTYSMGTQALQWSDVWTDRLHVADPDATGRTATWVITSANGTSALYQAQSDNIVIVSADASAAINAALLNLTAGRNYPQTVKLAGHFDIKDQISIPSYAHLEGDNEAFLQFGNAVNKHMIVNSNQVAGNTNIFIDGIHTDGARASQTGYWSAIQFIGVSDSEVKGNSFSNFGEDSVYLGGIGTDPVGTRVKVIDNTFSNVGRSAVAVTRNTQTIISRNAVNNILGTNASSNMAAFWIEGNASDVVLDTQITYNTVNQTTAPPGGQYVAGLILSTAADRTVFSNNIITFSDETNVNYGVIALNVKQLTGTANTVIRGNSSYYLSGVTNSTFSSNKAIIARAAGFYLTGSKNNTFNGDISWVNVDAGEAWQLVSSSDNNTFTGITGKNSGNFGFTIESGDYNTVLNSTFTDDQMVKTQTNGVKIYGGVAGTRVLYSNLGGNKTAAVSDAGTSSLFKGNIGYVTEGSGASVSTGSQQTIAHGQSDTPTKQQIAVFSDNVSVMVWQSAAPDGTNIYVSTNSTATGAAVTGSAWHWARIGN